MFVGRRAELGELRRVLGGDPPRLVRVYGRRRIGKTELLTQVLPQHPAVYLDPEEAEFEVQLRALARQRRTQGGDVLRSYGSWDDLLDDLERVPSRLVIFDEFQNLVRTGHGFLGRLQARWDLRWRKQGPGVVVCGSSVGMMQRLTRAPRAPLFGRITDNLHVGPLPYHEARELYPELSEEERIRRYAVFGGTPYYHTHSLGRPLGEAIWESFLRKDAPFLDEPEDLLRTEFQDATRPNSILREIGAGGLALQELESRVGVKHGGLGRHLVLLERDMDLVAREEPLLGKRRLGRYVLPDPFFRFHYGFISEHRNTVELGRGRALLPEIMTELETHVGRVFEDVVRDALLVAPEVGGHALDLRRIGRWWNRLGEEIDVVAVGKEEVWVGEVKWTGRPEGEGVVAHLLRKLPHLGGCSGKRIRPFVVARGGLRAEARGALEAHGGFGLDLKALQAIFETANGP